MEQIYLTRRNLETLLSMLDRHATGEPTFCSIVKFDVAHLKYPCSRVTCVTAVENSDYYTDRPPGDVLVKDEPS